MEGSLIIIFEGIFYSLFNNNIYMWDYTDGIGSWWINLLDNIDHTYISTHIAVCIVFKTKGYKLFRVFNIHLVIRCKLDHFFYYIIGL